MTAHEKQFITRAEHEGRRTTLRGHAPNFPRAITYTASVTVRGEHNLIRVDSNTTAFTVTLASGLARSQDFFIVIKDIGGNAGTNNITIGTEGSETIDGSSTYVLNTNRESISLMNDLTNFHIFSGYLT